MSTAITPAELKDKLTQKKVLYLFKMMRDNLFKLFPRNNDVLWQMHLALKLRLKKVKL